MRRYVERDPARAGIRARPGASTVAIDRRRGPSGAGGGVARLRDPRRRWHRALADAQDLGEILGTRRRPNRTPAEWAALVGMARRSCSRARTTPGVPEDWSDRRAASLPGEVLLPRGPTEPSCAQSGAATPLCSTLVACRGRSYRAPSRMPPRACPCWLRGRRGPNALNVLLPGAVDRDVILAQATTCNRPP